jgi:hypothetical protein
MNAPYGDKTIPLTKLMVIEAWSDYMNASTGEPCVAGFVRWVTEHQPEVLKLVGPANLAEIAAGLLWTISPEQGAA